MPYITRQMLDAAARAITPTFDTHAVIQELQRSQPQAYARDLCRLLHHTDPITSLHAEIGRRLLMLVSIVKVTKVRGSNIRGRSSYCQQWRRV